MELEQELLDRPLFRFQRGLYYTLEHLGFQLLKLLGIQPGAKLDKLGVVTLGDPDPDHLDHAFNQLESRLGLKLVQLGKLEIPPERVQWDSYLFVPLILEELVRKFKLSPEMGMLGISTYKLTMLPPLNLCRLIQRFHLVLGIANPWLRIALVTTLQGKLSREFFSEICLHEVGHLVGKHGYPMYG